MQKINKKNNIRYTLRSYRRSWGLSQKEMASLLGFESGAHISRLEQGDRMPSWETVLAYAVLFGVHGRELFPKLTVDIEARIKARSTELHDQLVGRKCNGPRCTQKRKLLAQTLGKGAADKVTPARV